MLVIIASGIYLVSERFEFSDFFVSWGMVAIVLLLGLAHGFFQPKTRAFVAAVEAGRDDEAEAVTKQLNLVGPIAGVIVILTIYVMTAKPFA